ncbi:MAG: BT4734/BF3469 family protein [Prolixibacteraceae bacterium]
MAEVYDLVTGNELAAITEKIRTGEADKTKTLPSVTPSGTFSTRKDANLLEYSGIICADFDHVNIGLKDTLAGDSFLNPSLVFVSPSGNGLKVFISIDNATAGKHLRYFQALRTYFADTYQLNVDEACKNISRACFLCHDQESYFSDGSIDSETLLSILPVEPTSKELCEHTRAREVDQDFSPVTTRIEGNNAANKENVMPAHTPPIYRRPSEDLNRLEAIHNRAKTALIQSGWTIEGEQCTRPGKDPKNGISAIYNSDPKDGFYKFTVYSDNAQPFAIKAYTDAQIICLLEFADNWKECIKQLTAEHLKAEKPQQTAPKEAKTDEYIRVGNIYLKQITKVDKHGNQSTIYSTIARQTLIDDFGKSFLQQVKKYDGFCNVPNNLNLKTEIAGNRNMYEPLQHLPTPGQWPTIKKFMLHIFGSQYEIGLDYLQILYLNPYQLLPVLCLVSVENSTGKTTFGNFLIMIFGANACMIGSSELTSQFNASFAFKLAIVVDESKIAKTDMERIKMMATAGSIQLRRMHTDHQSIDFFGKFILLSNNERDFINASENDQRFWIRKLAPVAFDPNFEDRLKSEIPAFLYSLQFRQLSTPRASRMHFRPELLETAELKAVKQESKSWLFKELVEVLTNYMNEKNLTECQCTANEIKKEFFKTDNRIGVSDIRRTIRDEMGLNPTKIATRYRFPEGAAIGSNVGKPYIFYISDLE